MNEEAHIILNWLLEKKQQDNEEWFTLSQISRHTGIQPQLTASALNSMIMDGDVAISNAENRAIYQAKAEDN